MAFRIRARVQQQRAKVISTGTTGSCARQVKDAMAESCENPQGIEVSLRVVAQKAGLPNRNRLCIVIAIPACQRQHTGREPRRIRAGAETPWAHWPKGLPNSPMPSERDRNGRLLLNAAAANHSAAAARLAVSVRERKDQSPQSAGGGKYVCVGQGALREPEIGTNARDDNSRTQRLALATADLADLFSF